jgi:hypothetical protein
MTPDTRPMKSRKSQISAKYNAIMFTKSDSGLRTWKISNYYTYWFFLCEEYKLVMKLGH